MALVAGLVAVGGVASYLQGPALREKWLAGQSLDSLKGRTRKDDPLASLIYAEALVKAGRSGDALPVLRDAVDALPIDASGPVVQRLLARYGHDLALNGYIDDAPPYLERALRLDAHDVRVYNGMALVQLTRQNFDDAEKQAKIATQMEPDNAEAWYLLGKVYNNSRRPESALEPLKKSVQLEPKFADSHAELGHAYAFQSQFGPAVDEFRKAIALNPKSVLYQRVLGAALAIAARTPEQYDEATKLLNKALAEEPGNEPVIYSLGQLHLRFNHIEEARKRLKEALALNPSNAEAWYNLAMVEKRLGNDAAYKQADVQFQHFSKLHDDSIVAEKKVAADLKNVPARVELARAYQRMGNVVGAYWQMRVALQLNPRQPDVTSEFAAITRAYQEMRKKAGPRPDDPMAMGPPPPGAGTAKPPAAGAAPSAPMPTPAPGVQGGVDDR